MEKSTENNPNNNFLKKVPTGGISYQHKKYLGTEVPEGYFAKSKREILDKINSQVKVESIKEQKQVVFWMRPNMKYMAAASLVFIFGLTIWLKNATQKDHFDTTDFELLSFSEDNLIHSLLVNDAEFEAFADATLLNEVILKAELSEQKIDQFFLNSLFIEDSLIDNYTNDHFIETIIL